MHFAWAQVWTTAIGRIRNQDAKAPRRMLDRMKSPNLDIMFDVWGNEQEVPALPGCSAVDTSPKQIVKVVE